MAITNVVEAYGNKLVGSQSSSSSTGSLSQLTDVTLSSPSDSEILTYDSTTNKWKNKPVTIPVNPSDTTNLNIWIEVDE